MSVTDRGENPAGRFDVKRYGEISRIVINHLSIAIINYVTSCGGGERGRETTAPVS